MNDRPEAFCRYLLRARGNAPRPGRENSETTLLKMPNGKAGMWRLLPLCLLVGCVATNPDTSSGDGSSGTTGWRIVRTAEMPLESSGTTVEGQSSKRTFRDSNVSGWLDEKGNWNIRAEISHGRIRCATCEVGIQLGRGLPACSNVDWLTNVEYATRFRHCNSATRIHSGGGLSFLTVAVEAANCARVVVRCEGC